jgi:hypothetical protein
MTESGDYDVIFKANSVSLLVLIIGGWVAFTLLVSGSPIMV